MQIMTVVRVVRPTRPQGPIRVTGWVYKVRNVDEEEPEKFQLSKMIQTRLMQMADWDIKTFYLINYWSGRTPHYRKFDNVNITPNSPLSTFINMYNSLIDYFTEYFIS